MFCFTVLKMEGPLHIDVTDLRLFVQIAETGNLAGGAEKGSGMSGYLPTPLQ